MRPLIQIQILALVALVGVISFNPTALAAKKSEDELGDELLEHENGGELESEHKGGYNIGAGLSDLLSSNLKGKGAPGVLQNLEHKLREPATIVGGAGGQSNVAKEIKQETELYGGDKKPFFGLDFSLEKLSKYIFNPFEFVKAIAIHFKIPLEKFLEAVGKPLVFGVEAFLQPIVIIIKIIEKVFVPDACRLKFFCQLGNKLDYIRDHVLKFSTHFLESTTHFKAFSDGVVGRDCEAIFPNCEPKLKKSFEELKYKPEGGEKLFGGLFGKGEKAIVA